MRANFDTIFSKNPDRSEIFLKNTDFQFQKSSNFIRKSIVISRNNKINVYYKIGKFSFLVDNFSWNLEKNEIGYHSIFPSLGILCYNHLTLYCYRVPPKETHWVLFEFVYRKSLNAKHLMTSRRRIRIILTEFLSRNTVCFSSIDYFQNNLWESSRPLIIPKIQEKPWAISIRI